MFRLPDGLPDNASFGDCLETYTLRRGISQNCLAACARVNQSRLNKISNERIKDVPVDVLVCICLALKLSVEESKDLMARKSRAFSPADPVHQAYIELIEDYQEKPIDYSNMYQITEFLNDADDALTEQGFPPLPNCDA